MQPWRACLILSTALTQLAPQPQKANLLTSDLSDLQGLL